MVIKWWHKNLLVLIFALMLNACSDPTLTDIEYLERGKNHFNSQDYRASIINLKNALQQNGGNVEARWLLGKAYLITGNGSAAEKELKRARELGVPATEIDYEIAKSLFIAREFHRVIDEFSSPSEALSAKNQSAILAIVALAHVETRQFEKAEAALEQARSVDENNPQVLTVASRLAVIANKTDEGRELMEQAINLAPKNSETWLAKGYLLADIKDFKQAEEAFQQAQQLEGNNNFTYIFSRATMGLLRTNIALNQTDAAKKHLGTLESANNKHFFVKYFKGVISFREGKLPEALALFQQLDKSNPNFLPNTLMLGSTHFAMGEYEQARVSITKFLSSVPQHRQSRKLLATIELKLENPEEALKILGDEDSGDVEILAMMADASVQLGDIDKSLKLIQAAKAKKPDSDALKLMLAANHIIGNDSKKAIKEIQKHFPEENKPYNAALFEIIALLKNDEGDKAIKKAELLQKNLSDDPRAHQLIGTLYLYQGKGLLASEQYNKALKIDPNFAPARLKLGAIAEATNKYDEAINQYQKVIDRDEQNAQAYIGLSRVAELNNDPGKSVAWLETARTKNTNAIEPRALLARHFIRQKDLISARKLAEEGEIMLGGAGGDEMV